MWPFTKKKISIQAAVLAHTLFDGFVQAKSYDPILELKLSNDIQQRYNDTLRICSICIIFISLIDEEARNPKFLRVKEAFELLVTPNREGRLTFHDELTNQMKQWQELISQKSKPRQLSWARAWFANIGIDVSNPVTLTLFVVHLMNYYIAIMDCLKEFEPT